MNSIEQIILKLKNLSENPPLLEKDDRCTRIAKRKYDVWPSAYASGAKEQCRQGKIWKGISEETIDESGFDKSLHAWFSHRGGKGGKGWVDCNTCRKDPKTGRKKCKSCGRQAGEKRAKYPACRPTPSQCTKAGTRRKKGPSAVSWKSKNESVNYFKSLIKECLEEVLSESLCAWCGKQYGTPGSEHTSAGLSHGICPTCKDSLLDKVRNKKDSKTDSLKDKEKHIDQK